MFSFSARWRETPAEPPVPAPDAVGAELAELRESALLDLTERHHAAMEEIDGLLKAELARGRDGRDARLFNALLDVRNALAPGSLILPLRPSVPVIPGNAS
ncbi:hypothetical protein [Actinoplanes sp. NPDC049118]|uniref:hypothetical protein n=1 Tax=Actinoplanes sp. NPDC049118 TaxID=3155769 RepID=UPI0033D33627